MSSALKPDFWRYLTAIFSAITPLRGEAEYAGNVPELRQHVRQSLKELHEFLTDSLIERDAYYILFALVAHLDEIAQVHLQQNGRSPEWVSLQSELFGVHGAGEQFFSYIDSFKGRNDIPQLVFETYYFCISDGFMGRFAMSPETQDTYRQDVKAYIQQKPIIPELGPGTIPSKKYFRPSPWMYYAAVLMVFFLVHQLLPLVPLNLPLALEHALQ